MSNAPPTASEPHEFADFSAMVHAVALHPWPYFTVTLAVPEGFGRSAPGQFVMTTAGFQLEPYLRRAFSVFDQRALEGSDDPSSGSNGWEIDIFGKVVGRGTADLAALTPGRRVPLLGPLGQGFEAFEVRPPQRVALVAGGIGSAALLLWARRLADARQPFDFLYGGRGAQDLALCDRFEVEAQRSGGEAIYATESGEVGHRGFITEPLELGLQTGRYGALYTCGPEGLMARVASLSCRYSVPGQAALETEMGCGFGACLGCAVRLREGGMALCCKDGPVFDLTEVAW